VLFFNAAEKKEANKKRKRKVIGAEGIALFVGRIGPRERNRITPAPRSGGF